MKKTNRKKWISETLYHGYRQSFEVQRLIHKKKSKYQNIMLFESTSHGKVLMIDGVVQLTEKDEHTYHEMLVHVPLFTHPNPKKVLIIGGGDGGAARRVLMHKNVQVTLVDIDPEITVLAKEHLQSVCSDVFDDPRLTVLHEDGAKYLATTDDRYDIILTDRGDPIGAMSVLFEEEYYRNCKRCLCKNGILVSLTGVPFMQAGELKESFKLLKSIFKKNSCYLTPVPTYIGGNLALTWSSDTIAPNSVDLKTLKRKSKRLITLYYTPEVHIASFAHPKQIIGLLK